MPPTSSSPIYLTIHPLSRRSLPFHVHTDVCKYYLCGVSPYALFKNTKSDLGEYDKEFDDDCVAEWNQLSQDEKDRYGYEYDLLAMLERLVGTCERRVKQHTSRIREEHDVETECLSRTALSEDDYGRLGEIEAEIAAVEAGAEALGLDGRVDEAVVSLSRCDTLRREMQQLEGRALQAARDKAGRKHMIGAWPGGRGEGRKGGKEGREAGWVGGFITKRCSPVRSVVSLRHIWFRFAVLVSGRRTCFFLHRSFGTRFPLPPPS